MHRLEILARFVTCALVLCLADAASAQPEPRSPDRIHIRIQQIDGELRASVDETFTFKTTEEALRWIEDRAAAWAPSPALSIQVDGAAVSSLPGIIERTARLPWKGTTLSLPAHRVHEIERIGTQLEKDKVLHFGKFLATYYEEQFGKDHVAPMWRDLQRALRERRAFLAANLILSLPTRRDATGNETWFADLPGDALLPEECLRNWMDMALSRDLSIEMRRILVDNLAKINERRAVEFCLQVLTREEDPVWLRGTGIRALSRIRDRDAILAGELSSTYLIPHEEDQESRRALSDAAAEARTWWAAVKATWPPQVLPSPRGR